MIELNITTWGAPVRFVPSPFLRRVFAILVVLNALDLGTSTEGGTTGLDAYIASRSPVEWVFQLALLAPLFVSLPTLGRSVMRHLRALPMPRATQAALAAVVAIQIAHVALRAEVYPFTCVGMFSDVELDIGDRPRFERVYLVDGRRVNFLRESSVFFNEHDLALDVKAAWLLRLNATGLGRTYGIVADALVARRHAPPVIAEVRYATGSGRIVQSQVLGIPRGYVASAERAP